MFVWGTHGNRLGGGKDLIVLLHEIAPAGWLGRIEALSGRQIGEAQREYLMGLGKLQRSGSVAQGRRSEGTVLVQLEESGMQGVRRLLWGFGSDKGHQKLLSIWCSRYGSR